MLPIEEHRDTPESAADGAHLVVGDLGVVVLRALLENGVGYVVSSWRDRPTPIDAAIDDARERLLVPRGVVLRRLRSLSALEPLITAPTGGITGMPPRGAIIFAGRRGLRPALEQFVKVPASGAVVGICFDDDALRIEDALVIDPEPTAIGLVRAIDQAFAASLAAGRPALVVIGERSLGMRGGLRARLDRSPNAAADADAAARAAAQLVEVGEAAEAAGLIVGLRGDGQLSRTGERALLVVQGPLQQAAERALAHVDAALVAAGAAPVAAGVSLIVSRVPGIIPVRDGGVGRLLSEATVACVIGARAPRAAERLRGVAPHLAPTHHALDPGVVRGEALVGAVAAWLLAVHAESDGAAAEVLASLAAGSRATAPAVRVSGRLPRRSEVLARSVTPTVAAGLVLAQGVVGVPARTDVDFPTYRTDTGVPLTIVPAAVFALHGAASAAPGSGAGVFLVTPANADTSSSAAAAGATIEHVDGGSPRAIGAAIGRACAAPRVAPHVIVIADVQRVAAPRDAVFGMDPDLIGTERLAMAVVPQSATALVELGDDLLAGPTLLALDQAPTHAVLPALRELTPATWDLRAARGSRSAVDRFGWGLRRRMLRSVAGVDL